MPYDNLPEKRRAYMRAYYAKNREKYQGRNQKLKANHKFATDQITNAVKAQPCQDCGVSYPPYVMDFHHRDPDKKIATIGQLKTWGASLKLIKEEIAKCDVLCSNCHRERTFGDNHALAQLVEPVKTETEDRDL